MSSGRNNLNPKPGGVLVRALAARREREMDRISGDPSKCVSLVRLSAIADRSGPARAEESAHINQCDRCSVRLKTFQSELAAATRAKVHAPDAELDAEPMSMPSIDTELLPFVRHAHASRTGANDLETIIASIFTAIRSVVTEPGSAHPWSLDGSWAILELIKKIAEETARTHAMPVPHFAATYADVVELAPVPMKVTFVYGITKIFAQGGESQPLAMQIAREIARRNDSVAHLILTMTVLGEAGHLTKGISSERWSEIEKASRPALYGYRQRIDAQLEQFHASFDRSMNREAVLALVRETAEALVDDMFRSRDAVDTVLHLLAVRHGLAAIVRHLQQCSDSWEDLSPEIAAAIFRRAREHGAPLFLPMEVCEKLRGAPSVSVVMEKLEPHERPQTAATADDEAIRA